MISIGDIVVKAVENGFSLKKTKINEIMSGEARYVLKSRNGVCAKFYERTST
jgi:hypothetical protein